MLKFPKDLFSIARPCDIVQYLPFSLPLYVREYKGHFKNDANILDIIYGTAKLKMFAELFCAYVVGWLELVLSHSFLFHSLTIPFTISIEFTKQYHHHRHRHHHHPIWLLCLKAKEHEKSKCMSVSSFCLIYCDSESRTITRHIHYKYECVLM